MCLTVCAIAGVPTLAATTNATKAILIRISGSSCARGRRCPAHRHLVQLLHLFPRSRDGALLPSAVPAHRRASEEDAAIRFAERGKSIRGTAATTASACERAKTIRRLLPERAVRGLEIGAQLWMHVARVCEDVFDASLD